METAQLTSELKSAARRLGFDLVGVCAAVTTPGWPRLVEWLAAGYAGEMSYLNDREAAYAHPHSVLDGARSIVMLALNYRTAMPAGVPAITPAGVSAHDLAEESAALRPAHGRVSRYAWGTDYHDLIRPRLNQLADELRRHAPHARARGVVDTAPLLEREFAQLAGLGWIGKNTLLLNKQAGSWFFLAALVTDVELVPDDPHETDHCGTCRACLDACPTDAFTDAYVLDARKCISYLTIELRGPIPQELRSGVGDWLFGCDVCQDVCPWNHRAPMSNEPQFEPAEGMNPVELTELFMLSDDQFRARFRHTPLWRAKRRGLLRNAAIVLGNQRDPATLPALERALHDSEPLVRGAAAWALGQFEQPRARQMLMARAAVELDDYVQSEICSALHSG
jgi:epoxyqueuosine reductase